MPAKAQPKAKAAKAAKPARGELWPPPSYSDEKVKAATGKGWMGWFIILNNAEASTKPHKEIAQILSGRGCPPGGLR